MTTGTDVMAFGGAYISSSTANSGTATWTFSVPAAGSYYVWGRVLAPSGDQDSFYVSYDGGSEDTYDDAEGTWSPNWQWTVLNGRAGTGIPLTIDPRVVNLTAGTNTLTFRGREAQSKVDRILVTADPNYVPTDGNVMTFPDVPPSNPFFDYIETLADDQITSGCGGGNYCPNGTVTRAQMAVFLLRSQHGASYAPPPATGNVFNDGPKTAFAAAWIEQLAAEGITSGCGGGNFCPTLGVTRAQMAVFLLRGQHGSSYVPPPAVGIFSDVAASDPFAPWIEQLYNEHVTAGCAPEKFCPNLPSTRGQMAVFLTRTFGLQ